MKTKKINIALLLISMVCATSCTKLEQEWYDQVVPETFFKSEKDIMAALYRPFTHGRWYLGGDRWKLQEYSADQFAITTKGRHWYNGGENERYHYHRWTPDDNWIWESWRGTLMGVALALDTKQDLENVDYEALALTQADKDEHLNQLNTLIAFFYMRGLDYFGGMPVFESLDIEAPPRNTDQETFDHIERLLLEAIDKLPAKEAGQQEEGAMKKAAAAAMLAQLYFNAEAYIGQDRFADAATICEAIINQEYGAYSLDPTWYGPHSFNNDSSPEIIWSIPSEFNYLQYDWFYADFYHYNTARYFDLDGGANNGAHLTPSLKPDGTSYASDFKLGRPYGKFHDEDLRKKPYRYLGGGQYEGMFIVGEHRTPTGEPIVGGEEYNGQLLVFVDQVARFSEVGPGEEYASVAELPSKMSEGEENTGVRLVKVPMPNNAEIRLRWGADNPVIRLAEIYYMLAECRLRAGDAAGAATLINQVRARNFENADPDPVTAANLDEYRMLDEWGIEFLGEGRRRTDLIRWNKFTTDSWWDHEPSDDHFKRFPIPTRAISGNNNLEQNPGYE
ncbi:RagB/SusD family nutrient uptake outer membrane protein [Parapedobacter sp. DT-150]|uniref:RagB/SusD family nutrient uptake outer membrane protein n=1 Tax=Parapedobacter sp. DT-150 TaxID=3396162 RepID=UPI003F1C47B5